jgi:nifR3 family TIM-barrel protein
MTVSPDVFKIGSIAVHGELILAPMDGISDLPFRNLCREFGSAMSYVPFIHARELLEGRKHVPGLLKYTSQERPVSLQLYDNSEDNLLMAAHKLREYEPDAIDINMACSIRSISSRGAGAGLLREPVKVGRIIHRLTSALDVPITVKIRLGWDEQNLNYLEIARVVEQNGAALIAVHGRTRQQRFSGNANWDAIAAVKHAVSIPVIGNGDVCGVDDIKRMKSHTGCDAIMIGRGAIGNPWIFGHQMLSEVPQHEVASVIDRHLDAMLDYYPERRAMLLFRKHLVRYLELFSIDDRSRHRILSCLDSTELRDLLSEASPEFHPGV